MATVVLDIGGTAIKSGIYKDGELSCLRETPTEAARGAGHVVRLALELVRSYQKEHELHRIGISTAGQVDPVAGRIIFANDNIPGYTGTELKTLMEQEFHLPTCVENDVNAAALGEAHFGAGRGIRDFVCLTYGTGVGGALFLNGSLYSGSSFCAGEFGGIVTHPEDRRPNEDLFSGCYERYASATALVCQAKKLDPSLHNGREIFKRQDEPAVRELIDRWILEIAYGLVTIIHMTNPACVILGGGVMEQDYILTRLQTLLKAHLMPSFSHAALKRAELGNRAGMLGAAQLHERTDRRELT